MNGEGQRVPGFRVQAVDTIAAGDTFNGALITALLEEKPLPEAIRFAHVENMHICFGQNAPSMNLIQKTYLMVIL